MKCYSYKKLLTTRQQAAVSRLYVRQRLPAAETAKRLRLAVFRVTRFLRGGGLLRPQGDHSSPQKISLAERQKLEAEMPTTLDAILARKYGVSRERIRQIRRELGHPSSQVIRHQWTLRDRAQRRQKKKLARELRRANFLAAINLLSKRWMSGLPVSELAREYGVRNNTVQCRISHYRKQFPEKFPFRLDEHRVQGKLARRARELWQQQLRSKRLLAM
jgi:hypothetical protein